MFKYQNIATVGERIRSYDFEHSSYYVEGVVERLDVEGKENGYAAFVITVDKDSFDDEPRVGLTVYVPMESAFDWEGRIVNLSKKAMDKDTLKDFIGNALFAIETNLAPLQKRIREGRDEEALEIIQDIEISVNKAKDAILAFVEPETGPQMAVRVM